MSAKAGIVIHRTKARLKRLVHGDVFDQIQKALERAEDEMRRTRKSVPRSLKEWITNWMMRGLWRTARLD